jgi:hypothetical protein
VRTRYPPREHFIRGSIRIAPRHQPSHLLPPGWPSGYGGPPKGRPIGVIVRADSQELGCAGGLRPSLTASNEDTPRRSLSRIGLG